MPGCQIVARLRKLSPIRLVNVFAFQLPQLFAAVCMKGSLSHAERLRENREGVSNALTLKFSVRDI